MHALLHNSIFAGGYRSVGIGWCRGLKGERVNSRVIDGLTNETKCSTACSTLEVRVANETYECHGYAYAFSGPFAGRCYLYGKGMEKGLVWTWLPTEWQADPRANFVIGATYPQPGVKCMLRGTANPVDLHWHILCHSDHSFFLTFVLQILGPQRACPAKLGRPPSPHFAASQSEQWQQRLHHWNHARPLSETCACTFASMHECWSHESRWPLCDEIGFPSCVTGETLVQDFFGRVLPQSMSYSFKLSDSIPAAIGEFKGLQELYGL